MLFHYADRILLELKIFLIYRSTKFLSTFLRSLNYFRLSRIFLSSDKVLKFKKDRRRSLSINVI